MNEPLEILITQKLPENLIDELRDLSPRIKITALPAKKPADVSKDVWERTQVLYTSNVIPDPEQAPNLNWIQFHWAGIEHVLDFPILRKPDLVATTLSGTHMSQMAEYVLMMILAFGHHLPEALNLQKQAKWPSDADRWGRFLPVELRYSTVGIIGYGSIGRQVARLLNAFGARILATKRDLMHPEDEGYYPEDMGDPESNLIHRLYPPQALKSILKECDFIVVSLPKTPETKNLIGSKELEACKPTAYLVDVSRGGIVDHSALLRALKEKQLAGAALDVFNQEPLPADSPLWKQPNLIITPHISGVTRYYDRRAVELFSENIKSYLAGTKLYNVIDLERGY